MRADNFPPCAKLAQVHVLPAWRAADDLADTDDCPGIRAGAASRKNGATDHPRPQLEPANHAAFRGGRFRAGA